MDILDTITGRDMKKQWNTMEARAKKLPRDFQGAWDEMKTNLWQHASFSGRNVMPLLEGVMELMEEEASQGRGAQEVFGGDIDGFCAALATEEGAKSFRDRWRDQLNQSIRRRLGR